MPDAYTQQPNGAKEVVISIKGLYKSFEDLHVLRGIDLDVCKGENVVVMGLSGSGKSVLIKLIAGILKPDAGRVMVLGKEVGALNKHELRQLRLKIGFLFQGSALYDSMTIKENLEFSLVRHFKGISSIKVNSSISEMLESLGLEHTENKMPSELSGGQKKRVGIARTLILQPEIMLYDEPTGGLDPVTSSEINDLIMKVQATYNTTSVIITHDLTCAKSTGNRLLMLYDGKFIREGNFEELFDTDDPRIRLFYDYNFIK